MRGGETVRAPVVVSNASVWDTYGKLLPPGAVSQKEKEDAMGTPYSESFMHLHLGVDAGGLDLTELGATTWWCVTRPSLSTCPGTCA